MAASSRGAAVSEPMHTHVFGAALKLMWQSCCLRVRLRPPARFLILWAWPGGLTCASLSLWAMCN